MGPALTTGWYRVINGLHREINCSAAISSTRKMQPLRFEVFYERVVTVINMCFLLLVSISCICGFVQPESKREWLWGKKWNYSLLWKQCAASQHSLNPACLCAPSSFYSLFSDTPHFSILWTFISMGGIQNKQTHLVLPGYHRHTHSL